jgi:septum formation protein
MNFILASGSPRRRDLLHAVGVPITMISPANIPEVRRKDETPLVYCQRLAEEKSTVQTFSHALVLAADTIVAQENTVFEKPKDNIHAHQILLQLQGSWHEVITAWSLFDTTKKIIHSGHAISRVQFRPLSQQECSAYIRTGEGKDKAGAYGIQGLGASLVSTIEGSYSNIVGLPMEQIMPILHQYKIMEKTP